MNFFRVGNLFVSIAFLETVELKPDEEALVFKYRDRSEVKLKMRGLITDVYAIMFWAFEKDLPNLDTEEIGDTKWYYIFRELDLIDDVYLYPFLEDDYTGLI